MFFMAIGLVISAPAAAFGAVIIGASAQANEIGRAWVFTLLGLLANLLATTLCFIFMRTYLDVLRHLLPRGPTRTLTQLDWQIVMTCTLPSVVTTIVLAVGFTLYGATRFR